jgi:hypothetical protein
MIFVGSGSVTLSECDINELHIGLKGTMDALYLKDLADKTRRGLRGRVENGKSGGPDASARLGLDLRQHLFVSGVQLGKDRARAGLFGFTTGGGCNWLVRDKARRAEETFDETAGGLGFDDARRLLRGPKPMGPRLP